MYLSAPGLASREVLDSRDAHRDAQDLSRRAAAELRARSPHANYYKDPRDFDPQDPRAREMYAHQIAATEEAHRREGPPPAHSHHGGRPQTDALHQLANAAMEQREQQLLRPHSEPRDKSSAMFHPADRSQMTPPVPRPSSSPYQQSPVSVTSQRLPMGPGQRQPIGQPPPLINIKSPKVTVKTEKMSPAGGSITAGTPVQSQSSGQHPVRYEGASISSGTPRYDPQSRHAPPGEGPRGPQALGGSITRGTPVNYDQQQQQLSTERRLPVSSHEGGPSKMSQAAIIDAATREAVARDVMYHERMLYDRAAIQMYQMGQRRLSPTGITLVSSRHFENNDYLKKSKR